MHWNIANNEQHPQNTSFDIYELFCKRSNIAVKKSVKNPELYSCEMQLSFLKTTFMFLHVHLEVITSCGVVWRRCETKSFLELAFPKYKEH